MTKKETRYFGTAMLVNGLQLLLCFIIYVVGMIVSVNNVVIAMVMLIAEVIIWLICGFKVAVSGDMDKVGKLFLAVLIALFPILLYTGISYGVSRFIPVESQGWTHFFFLGGPLIFFNKPITLLMAMFKGSGYLLFLVNYAVMGISYFIGELLGYAINGGKRRKNKKAIKENNVVTKPNKKDKKAKKEKKNKRKLKKKEKVEEDSEKVTEEIDDELSYKKDELNEISNDEDKIEEALVTDTTTITKDLDEKEDKLAAEIVNSILKENLKEQQGPKNEDE